MFLKIRQIKILRYIFIKNLVFTIIGIIKNKNAAFHECPALDIFFE